MRASDKITNHRGKFAFAENHPGTCWRLPTSFSQVPPIHDDQKRAIPRTRACTRGLSREASSCFQEYGSRLVKLREVVPRFSPPCISVVTSIPLRRHSVPCPDRGDRPPPLSSFERRKDFPAPRSTNIFRANDFPAFRSVPPFGSTASLTTRENLIVKIRDFTFIRTMIRRSHVFTFSRDIARATSMVERWTVKVKKF